GRADVDEVLEKLGGHPLIHRILLSQLECNTHQVQAEESHPPGCVGLFKNRAIGKLFSTIYDCNVVQTKKAALEHVVSLAIDTIHPPGEVHQELMQAFLQEGDVAIPGALLL